MGRYSYTSNVNDGYIRSKGGSPSGGNVTIAQEGTGQKDVFTADTITWAGQWRASPTQFEVEQAFLEYTFTPAPATELVTNAQVVLNGLGHTPDGDPWSLEVREFDWGGTLTSADFVPKANLQALTQLAAYPEIRERRPAPSAWRCGSAALRTRVTTASPLRVILHSNKQYLGFDAGGNGDEFVYLGAFEGGSTFYRPSLEFSTTTVSSLTRARAASCQLSDGTHVYLDVDTPGSVLLKHNPSGTTYTTVATLSIGSGAGQFALADGANAFSVTADASNNIYVAGPDGAAANSVRVQAFAKGGGYSWVAKTALSGALPTYDVGINQIAATWHSTSGAGHLALAVAHSQGYIFENQTVLVATSCTAALAGAGTLITATAEVPAPSLGAPVASSGSNMDILARTAGAGIIAATGASNRVYRYTLSSIGGITTTPTSTELGVPIFGATVTDDGNGHTRIVPISSSRFAVLCCGNLALYTDSGTFARNNFATINLAGNATFGSNGLVAHDAVYDAATNKIQVYYFDVANSRRVMRTGLSVASGLLDGVQTQVATNTGASGSSNLAIRLPRGSIDERRLLIHLGNKTGGGVNATVTVAGVDLDQVPNQPVLTNPGTFPADTAKVFSWTRSDNNPRDAQTAYQAQIRDQSSAVVVSDSGKVLGSATSFVLGASTLSNSETYEWRVRTYDLADQVSAYSAYQQFSTASSGVVSIVVPDADNPPGLASPTLDIEWNFTVTPPQAQAEYRVRVVRTDSGATVFDSGYVPGPAVTTYQVRGLISDVEQRIEVLIKDSSAGVSNTATRLVTPSFSAPDAPIISAVPNAEQSGVVVTVDNPEPTGDLPPAGRNDIYRAIAGTDVYIKVGETTQDGVFTDYQAAVGELYDYKVFAVAEGQTESNVVENVQIAFLGLYVHLPTSAAPTLRYFQFGGATNGDTVGTSATELRFVGRAYPVFEYGEHHNEIVDVQIVVPFESTWAADVAYLRELARSQTVHCYRDGRGRKVFGVINEVQTSDQMIGSVLTLSVTRVDYVEEVA